MDADCKQQAPNDTVYKWWSCHSCYKLLCKLCRNLPPQQWGPDLPGFLPIRPCGPTGWLALLLIKAGDVELNPGQTTTDKQVWICDICHKQIHCMKQISIRCNRIEHWVHLRCAGIRQEQYTDTWTCHLQRESRLISHTDITPPLQTQVQAPYPLPTYTTHTTATQIQTHVEHSPYSHRIGKAQTQSSHPLTPSTPTPPQAKHIHIHISHTPPTPLIRHTTLIYSTSAALDTIPEPRVPPTCPALTTTTPHPSSHQHCRHPRTLTLSHHTHKQQ